MEILFKQKSNKEE